MNQQVIIIGVTHHNTLGVIRSVGKHFKSLKCCTLILFGESESYLTSSDYVDDCYFLETSDQILPFLLKNKPRIPSCIITTTDEAGHQLDIHYNELKPYYKFFHAKKQGDITKYMDKQVQATLAYKIGIKVPKSYTEKDISFPCLIKPLKSINGGKNIIICKSENEYYEGKKIIGETPCLIQEFIKKENEIVLVGLSMSQEIIIPAVVKKIRDSDGGTDYASIHPINSIPKDFIDKCKLFIRTIGYEGLFGIEFIVSNNEYYYIETNLRNDATAYSVAIAGYNLIGSFIKYSLNNITDFSQPCIKDIYSVVEFRDFDNVLHGKINLFKWLSQVRKSKCKYFFDSNDLAPFLINLKMKTISIIRAAFHKFM